MYLGGGLGTQGAAGRVGGVQKRKEDKERRSKTVSEVETKIKLRDTGGRKEVLSKQWLCYQKKEKKSKVKIERSNCRKSRLDCVDSTRADRDSGCSVKRKMHILGRLVGLKRRAGTDCKEGKERRVAAETKKWEAGKSENAQ